MSVLDLQEQTAEQLLKSMDYQTRRNIKKTFEMGVEVRTLDYSETDTFYEHILHISEIGVGILLKCKAMFFFSHFK